MELKTFGFKIKGIQYPIEVKAKTEKQALIKLCEKHYGRIIEEDGAPEIQLWGEMSLSNPTD